MEPVRRMNAQLDSFVENWSNCFIVTPSMWPSNVANARLKVILAPIGGDERLKRNAGGGEQFLKA